MLDRLAINDSALRGCPARMTEPAIVPKPRRRLDKYDSRHCTCKLDERHLWLWLPHSHLINALVPSAAMLFAALMSNLRAHSRLCSVYGCSQGTTMRVCRAANWAGVAEPRRQPAMYYGSLV